MSIHVQLTEEAKAKLEAQRRNSTIASLVITVLTLTLVGLILFYIFLQPLLIEIPTMVTYQEALDKEPEVTSKKISTQVLKKPPAAASSMAKVIASSAPSNVSIPVPEENTPEPSLDFGDSDDFGEGWGEGEGFGEGGGSVSFFGQTSSGKNICFVIDYSASMRGERDDLMREELAKSLDTLGHGMSYSLIFFAGPVWIAGDEFKPEGGSAQSQTGTFKTPDGDDYKWEKGKGWVGKRRKAEWVAVSDDSLKTARKHVRNTPLVWGTNWLPPLEMALDMDPPPDIINFMTDGSTGNTDKLIKDITKTAKKHGTIINCVALMEPKAKEGMMKLAEENGGQFTMIEGDKKKEKPKKKK